MVDFTDVLVGAGTELLDQRDARLAAEAKAAREAAERALEFDDWYRKKSIDRGFAHSDKLEERAHQAGLLKTKLKREDFLRWKKLKREDIRRDEERLYQFKLWKIKRHADNSDWLTKQKIKWKNDKKVRDEVSLTSWYRFLNTEIYKSDDWKRRKRFEWEHERKVKGEDRVADWDTWFKRSMAEHNIWMKQQDHTFKKKGEAAQLTYIRQQKGAERATFIEMHKQGSIKNPDLVIKELLGAGVITPTDAWLMRNFKKAPDIKDSVAVLKELHSNVVGSKITFNPWSTFEEFDATFPDKVFEQVFKGANKKAFYGNVERAANKHSAANNMDSLAKNGLMELRVGESILRITDPASLIDKIGGATDNSKMPQLLSSMQNIDNQLSLFLSGMKGKNKKLKAGDLTNVKQYMNSISGVYDNFHKNALPENHPNSTLTAEGGRFFPKTQALIDSAAKDSSNASVALEASNLRNEDDKKRLLTDGKAEHPDDSSPTVDLHPKKKVINPIQNISDMSLITGEVTAKGSSTATRINWDAKDHIAKHADVFSIDADKFENAVRQTAAVMLKDQGVIPTSPNYAAHLANAKTQLQKQYERSFLMRDLSITFQRYASDPKKSMSIFEENNGQFYSNLIKMGEIDETFDPVGALEEAMYLATPTHSVKRDDKGRVINYPLIHSGTAAQGNKDYRYGAIDPKTDKYKMDLKSSLSPKISLKNVNGSVITINNMLDEIDRWNKLTGGDADFSGAASKMEGWVRSAAANVMYSVSLVEDIISGKRKILREDRTQGSFLSGSKDVAGSTSHFREAVRRLDLERKSILSNYRKTDDPREKARWGILANLNSMKIRFAYQLSSMLQGEGQGGGRTISDVDFQNAMIAISGTPIETLAKLNSLKREFTDKKARLETAIRYDPSGKLPAIDKATMPLRRMINNERANNFYGLSNSFLGQSKTTVGLSYKSPVWRNEFAKSIDELDRNHAGFPLLTRGEEENNRNIRKGEISTLTALTEHLFIKSDGLNKLADHIISNPSLTAHGVIAQMKEDQGIFKTFDEEASKDIDNKMRTFLFSISPITDPRSVLREKDGKFYIAGANDTSMPTSLFFKYRDKIGQHKQGVGEYLGDITKKALTNALISIIAHKNMSI
jgi:hypothetical protein